MEIQNTALSQKIKDALREPLDECRDLKDVLEEMLISHNPLF
ncbi:MAG: hypothetical protein ACE5IR_12465 [bacterium]